MATTKTNRRNFLRNGAAAAAAAAAAVGVTTKTARAQGAAKKAGGAAMARTPPTTTSGYAQWTKRAGVTADPYNARVAYGPLLFISGMGYHEAGDVKAHTKNVLDQIEAALKEAGSS